MQAFNVKPELLEKTWPLVKEWVAQGLKRGKGNDFVEDIERKLERGLMTLWLAWDKGRAKGCCITEFHTSST